MEEKKKEKVEFVCYKRSSRVSIHIAFIIVKGKYPMLIKSISDLAITENHNVSQLATFASLDHFASKKFVLFSIVIDLVLSHKSCFKKVLSLQNVFFYVKLTNSLIVALYQRVNFNYFCRNEFFSCLIEYIKSY